MTGKGIKEFIIQNGRVNQDTLIRNYYGAERVMESE